MSNFSKEIIDQARELRKNGVNYIDITTKLKIDLNLIWDLVRSLNYR